VADPNALPDRPELAAVWGRHIYTFMFGVLAERERIDGSFLAQRPERWADAWLYAYALRNLLRACWAAQAVDASGRIKVAVEAFEKEVPNAIQVRHALDKFDSEERAGGMAVWVGGKFGLGELSLHVDNTQTGDHVLDLDVATKAARRMGEACLDVLKTIAPSGISDV
jgi:hypothetical protein